MAKPLADCRIRIEFPKKGKTYNFGLFGTPSSTRLFLKKGIAMEEVTPSSLSARIARWIGGEIG